VRSIFSPPYQGGARGGLNAAIVPHSIFALNPTKPTLLVTGASQGARTINEAVIGLASEIAAAGWQVLHLSGSADRDRVQSAYTKANTPAVVLAFTDQMAEAMAAADLIVSRAGASSLAELLAMGKPSILLPYPFHRDRHQSHNGQVLVDAGAAIMLEDQKDASANIRALAPVLTMLMTDTAKREKMSQAARALGRPEAADLVAECIVKTACIEATRPESASNPHTSQFFAFRTT
jgi:UDP-N-acetylglucosamine--N-acetylmuramyl-(pentapeptide) pyrophosphoryl-undecaprenol N-acetylglucosamine transferase